jgi:hypothetical protein
MPFFMTARLGDSRPEDSSLVLNVSLRFSTDATNAHREGAMKIAIGIAIVAVALTASAASAQYLGNSNRGSSYGSGGLSGTGSNPNSHYVAPHMNQSGSYVGGHQQTNPNNTQLDNYGTRGNINPYTGAVGPRGGRY